LVAALCLGYQHLRKHSYIGWNDPRFPLITHGGVLCGAKEAFEAAFESGAHAIVCLCVSGEVSATYGAAVVAQDLFPDREIRVVDTQTLAMAQGFMVLAAAEAAQAGTSVEEIVAQAEGTAERLHLYAALSTLKYLAMSGRVGHLAAGMANLLNVKPILSVQEGKLDLLERVRTRGKAWARVIDLIQDAAAGKQIERLSILHVRAPSEAAQFRDLLCEKLACPEGVLEIITDDYDDEVAAVVAEHRKRIKYSCAPCKPDRDRPTLPCVGACTPNAITHSW